MSGLEEIQKKLYLEEKPSLPPVEEKPKPPPPPIEPPKMPDDIELSPFVWKKIWIGFGLFVVLAAVIGAFIFFRGFYAFRKENVDVKITAPNEVTAGDTAVWKLSITNKNETELLGGELVFQYPDFSKPILESGELDEFNANTSKQTISIPELKASGLYEREFRAVIFGGENFERKAQTVFTFRPSSGNISFESIATKSLKISSLPINISVSTAPESVSGEDVEITLHIKNESQTKFENLRVRFEYPAGFDAKASSEKLYEFNNVWKIDEILPNESKDLIVTGTVNGLAGEKKIFRVFIEGLERTTWRVYKETSTELKLITPPLAVYLNTEPAGQESFARGQNAFYKIIWQNNLDIPLSNLTLKVKFNNDVFDFLQSDLAKGVFDVSAKTVTWTQNNLPDLFGIQPMGKGELVFKVKMKSDLPEGFSASVTATIESTTKPEGLSVSKIISSQSLDLEVR